MKNQPYDPVVTFNSFMNEIPTPNQTYKEKRQLDILTPPPPPDSDHDPEGDPPQQPLPPGLAYTHWSLDAQATEIFDNAPPIVTTGGWDVDDEGRIRTSIPHLSIDLPNPGPPSIRELGRLINQGLWFIPPGRTGEVHLTFQLEQSVLAILDVNAIFIANTIRPFRAEEIATLDFLQRFSRDRGLFYLESRPSGTRSIDGTQAILLASSNSPDPLQLPNGGRYILIGATASPGESSFWYPGPTNAVGWQAISWRQPMLHHESVIGASGPVGGWLRGDFNHTQIAHPLQIPRVQPRFGGEIGATSFVVNTSGRVSVPKNGGFIGQIAASNQFRLFFTGYAGRGTTHQQWPVGLTHDSWQVHPDVQVAR